MRKLLITFKSEAEEHIKAISNGLLTLEKKLTNEEHQHVLDTIFREAHSLKGASRAVNLNEIQDFCQTLEHIFAAWKKHDLETSEQLFDTLYQAIDLMTQVIKAPDKEARQKKASEILDLTQRLLRFLEKAPSTQDSTKPSQVVTSDSPKEVSVLSVQSKEIERASNAAAPLEKENTIRISVSKLDHLLQEVEEMLNVKLSTNQQAASLEDIKMLLEKWKKHASRKEMFSSEFKRFIEEQNKSGGSTYSKKMTAYFNSEQLFIKSIQESIGQAAKLANQESRLVDSMVDTLLEDTKKALMQPFLTILESFPRMVRDLSHSLKKEVNLEWHGENIEVDKRLLEELKAPLIHLIRNSIDHGIETPDERALNKKAPQGKIQIDISQISGNKIELLFSDDGRGIDTKKIKEYAIKKGALPPLEADQLSESELLRFLVHSAISTKDIVTELSGRGLGLGILAEKVEKLHGELTIETHEKYGTTFKILLPTTLATFRGVQIEVSERPFIVPTHHVLRAAKVKHEDVKNIENRRVVLVDGRMMPLLHLGHLLSIPNIKEEADNPKSGSALSIVILKASDKIIAFEVDHIFGEKDILVKGLGKLIPQLKYTMAATITEWGKVIPILSPQDLIKGAMKGHKETAPAKPSEIIKPTILLCEDSITSRMLLFNILDSSGYDVKSAIDGEEGLLIFEREKIDLVLTDIEMPRMDGWTLTQRIRAMDKGRHIPIILCTSLESQEDKERGIKVGANAYLEKSSFTQSNLLDIIHKLL